MFLGFPDQFMDCEHSFDANLVAGLVDGSKCPYHFLDSTESDAYNTDLFLKQHMVLTTTLKTLQAKYLRLCFEYFFISIKNVYDCVSVSWAQYFKNFSIKVKKEIRDYNAKAHLTEVAQKYNLVLNDLTSKDKKSLLSCDGYSKRIDNQLRSMNVSVWHCAATVFALYREFVQPNNLSNEFEYEVSKEIADLFLSNEKFKSKLSMSEEQDIEKLGRICQTTKDRRTQFGDQVNRRNHEARVPRKCYKGQSIEVGSKRKEMSMKSSDLKSTSKKLKRSDIDEGIGSDEYSNGELQSAQDESTKALLQDIFGDDHSEDIAGLQVSSAIAVVGNDAVVGDSFACK
jgi:hypothetical protein